VAIAAPLEGAPVLVEAPKETSPCSWVIWCVGPDADTIINEEEKLSVVAQQE
jgi:hypothetical protein